MFSWSSILISGAALCLGMSLLIFGSLIYNPRLWLQDYPESIRQQVPPLSSAEKQIQRLFLLVYLLVMLGIPYVSTALLRADQGGSLPFITAYLNAFVILNIGNLWDAVGIDLPLAFLKPAFIILPGTQVADYAAFEDWGLQGRNYLKGIVFCVVMALPVALVAIL